VRTPPVVSAEEWNATRQELLRKEKEHTRAKDALAAERRRLPWLRVEKQYTFEGPQGKVSLPDLFEGRRQLIVYRHFFEPGVADWPKGGCSGCAMVADNLCHLAHVNARDVTFVLASAAPQADIERYRHRMGWDDVPWYTTQDDFSKDFGVDEYFGFNVFIRHDGDIYRTYFTNGRAAEQIGTVWSLLDLTPLGRQEEWEDSPEGCPQEPPYLWWRRHDEYGTPVDAG
jgi:predicted dithiol-disulfide oxidoreductase (DUF899 family)